MAHDIGAKAAGYGMESAVIDGMDVVRTYQGLKPLVDRCRQTCRPVLADVRTYRFKGHSMSDPRKYRTREEEERFEQKDPIERLRAALASRHGLTDEAFEALKGEVRRQVQDAMKWAEESPEPPVSELYTDVYAEPWGPYRGTTPPMILGGDPPPAAPKE
jgi:pyruvate dehydrogenase E1 component alpha subunit